MKRILLAIVAWGMLVGCATGIHPNSLKPVSSKSKFSLAQDIQHKNKGVMTDVVETLSKGTYISEYEDKYGTYYRGSGRCVSIVSTGGYNAKAEGGIWLPKKGIKKTPRIYVYIHPDNDPTKPGNGALFNALIERDYGRITFGRNILDDDFLKNIIVSPGI